LEVILRQWKKRQASFSFMICRYKRSKFLFQANGLGDGAHGEIFKYSQETEQQQQQESNQHNNKSNNTSNLNKMVEEFNELLTEEEKDEEIERGSRLGIRWSYYPSWESRPANFVAPAYVDVVWNKHYLHTRDTFLDFSTTIGVAASALPFQFSGFNLGTSILAAKDNWTVGVDVQLRDVNIDLTGGRTYMNSIAKYDLPEAAICLNFQEYGQRLVTSFALDPEQVFARLRRSGGNAGNEQINNNKDNNSSPHNNNININNKQNNKLVLADWLIGGEIDYVQRGTHYKLHRWALALAKRNVSSTSTLTRGGKRWDSEFRVKFDLRHGIAKTGRVSLCFSKLVDLSEGKRFKVTASAQANVFPFDHHKPDLKYGLAFTLYA
jgi:hypothetical protein